MSLLLGPRPSAGLATPFLLLALFQLLSALTPRYVAAQTQPTSITLSLNPTSVDEEAGSAQTITVTATIDDDKRFSSAQTVAIAVGGGDSKATSGTDYIAVADFNISIAANAASGEATFDITPINDNLHEGTGETVEVHGTLSGITVNKATLTITDEEWTARISTRGPCGFRPSSCYLHVDEAGASTYTLV